jgi:glycosyltransferase involved in cell wall biosynthesis
MIRDDRPMEPRARVLAVAQSADLGGAELALLRVAKRLPEHGIDIEIAAPGAGPMADAAAHRMAVGDIQAGAWGRAVLGWPRARRIGRGFDAVLLNGIVTQRLAPAMWTTTLVPYVHELTDKAPRAWRSPRFWRATPVVLCACEAVAQRCRAFGAPADRLRTVYAPVEVSEPAERPAWADRPVVGYVGLIAEHKGTLELVRAMQAVEARLVVAGDGDGAYAEQVRAEAGEDAVFLGRVDAGALMPWFDMLAVPSHREAFGTVAAEALAAGTPVVATRSGGIEEYVVPGRNGDLVPPGDVEGLANAIRGLLPRAASMADAARDDASRFDAGRVTAAIADAIHEAIARRAG